MTLSTAPDETGGGMLNVVNVVDDWYVRERLVEDLDQHVREIARRVVDAGETFRRVTTDGVGDDSLLLGVHRVVDEIMPLERYDGLTGDEEDWLMRHIEFYCLLEEAKRYGMIEEGANGEIRISARVGICSEKGDDS